MDKFEKPWSWRKGIGGVFPSGDRDGKYFHAHDVNCNAACDIHVGLIESVEEPNENSELCPACIDVVQANPSGRPKKFYRSAVGE